MFWPVCRVQPPGHLATGHRYDLPDALEVASGLDRRHGAADTNSCAALEVMLCKEVFLLLFLKLFDVCVPNLQTAANTL